MPGTQAARRYAKALLSLAQARDAAESGASETIGAQLQELAALFAAPEFAGLLAAPGMAPAARRTIAEQVTAHAELHPLVGKFLLVLADRDRLRDIGDIGAAYGRLLDAAAGRVRARIRSATELPDADKQRLTDAFGELTKKTFIPRFETDRSLLGGVVVEVEGRVYDASLKTRLARLGDRLARP